MVYVFYYHRNFFSQNDGIFPVPPLSDIFLISTLFPWSSADDSFLMVLCLAMSFSFLWLQFCRAFWCASFIWLFQSSTNLECEWPLLPSSVGSSIKSIGRRGFCLNKRKCGAYPVHTRIIVGI